MSDQQQFDIAEIDARIMELTRQRNEAMDRCVLLTGTLTIMQKRLNEQQAEIDAKPKKQAIAKNNQ